MLPLKRCADIMLAFSAGSKKKAETQVQEKAEDILDEEVEEEPEQEDRPKKRRAAAA